MGKRGKKKPRMGRPCKLNETIIFGAGTPEERQVPIRDAIMMLIRQGNRPLAAAAACGVGESTFMEWMAKGRAGNPDYRDFAEAIKTARMAGTALLVDKIRKAADDPRHWTAGAWLLERSFPDDWGNKQQIELKVRDGVIRELLDLLEQKLPNDAFKLVADALGLSPRDGGAPEAPGRTEGGG